MGNKLANGKQCNLVWCVDDDKVSLMESKSVKDLINDLEKHFVDLVVTIGNNHTFLGMNVNITEDKKVDMEMKEKLSEAIEAFGENIYEKVTTPASSHLFIVNEQSQQLYEEKREVSHLVVEKLLFIMRRARPDLETEISFLCRRFIEERCGRMEKPKESAIMGKVNH